MTFLNMGLAILSDNKARNKSEVDMHYYKKNIGDYYKKAGRLTMLQHGAYLLLIDSCYDREKFPTLEEAIDWCWASTKEEIEAVNFVLTKFFTLDGDVYEQKRIKEEVEKYQENCSTNRQIAIDREKKKREGSTGQSRSVDDSPPNQEPRTKNQEPIKNKQNKELFVLPDNIDPDTWKAFIEHRRKLKAPMTDRAKTLMINKLLKLHGNPNDILNQSIENGWKGAFELKEQNNGQNKSTNQSRGGRVNSKLDKIAQDAIDRGETL